MGFVLSFINLFFYVGYHMEGIRHFLTDNSVKMLIIGFMNLFLRNHLKEI